MTPDARRNRLVLVAAATLVVAALLVLARGALFPFVISGILAYLLYPVLDGLEAAMPWRARFPNASRIASILVIYLLAIAVLVGALALILPPTFQQANEFLDDVPEFYDNAVSTVAGWNQEYANRISPDIRAQIEEWLNDAGSILLRAGRTVLVRTVSAVSNALTIVLGVAIIPIFLFYLLKDRDAAVQGSYSLLPEGARRHARNVVAIVNSVFGAYIRAQLFLGAVVGVTVFLGLVALGIRFPALLAVTAGVTELVPIIGPILGAIPGVLVTLATSPGQIVWVALLYGAVQLLENTFLVPRIQGRAVEIHPGAVMVILVVASEAAGLFGVLVAVPLAAVAKDVFKYFYDEWSRDGPGPVDVSLEDTDVLKGGPVAAETTANVASPVGARGTEASRSPFRQAIRKVLGLGPGKL